MARDGATDAGRAVVALVIVVLFFVSLVESPERGGYPLGLVRRGDRAPGGWSLFSSSGSPGVRRPIDQRHGLYED